MLLLRQNAPDLFEEVKSGAKDWDATTWAGKTVHLSRSLAQRIDDFLVAQEQDASYRRMPKPKSVQPPPPKVESKPKPAVQPTVPEQSEPERFKEETRKIIEAESKRLKDEREAEDLLNHYQQQGLLNNQHNTDLIVDFIYTSDKLKSLQGRFTKQSVYLAVDFLGPKGSNVLQWRPKEVAAPPPAATPKPWKPGDPLPDNATVAQLHAASVEEVKEWKRRKQGKDGR